MELLGRTYMMYIIPASYNGRLAHRRALLCHPQQN